jgi:hypothetical protein
MRGLLSARQDLPTPMMPSTPPAAPVQAKKRPKLWDLEHKHHCPVIGTCLRMDDLGRFARRYQLAAALDDEFALHVETVSCCQSRNVVSEALQKFLDRKYEMAISRFAKLKTDKEILAAWRVSQAKGDIAGPMWAVYTHKASSVATRDTVYGDVHMLSHQIGAGQAADTRRLDYLEKENAELKRSLDLEWTQHQTHTTTLKARLAELETSVSEQTRVRDELIRLQERVSLYESGEAMAELGHRLAAMERTNQQMAAAMQRINELENALQAAQQQAMECARQRDDAAAERDALERLLLPDQSSAPSCDGLCACCEAAPSGRCVLYVGGRASLVAQYRELAQRLGVRLVHHDGGLEEALSRLPELIQSADAVICPTDCISHSAYYNLKSHCKRTGTPCLFFRGAGIASFATAIARVNKGEFSLAGQPASACNALSG